MAMKAAIVAVLVVLAFTTMMSPRVEGLTCGQVSSSLAPCIPYLKGGTFSPSCCSGVKNLNGMAQTPADRKTACTCIKSTANSISGIDYGLAAGLPGKCGVSIPYKISPSTDCNSVN